MRLNTNVMSLNVFRNYQKNLNENSAALGRISSGSKIMSAKDNPNKLGQSESFKLQLKGLQAASKNLQDGSSMLQTADGGIDGISSSLIRMKELVIKAGNDSNTDEDRDIIQKEIDSIKTSINDLANNTEFNGVKLIGDKSVSDNKQPGGLNMTSGANKGENINIPTHNLSSAALVDSKGNSIDDIDITNGNIDDSLNVIDEAIKTANSVRSKYGALQNRFESLASANSSNELMLTKAQSVISGADIAKEMMEFTRTNILIESGNAMMAQTNQIPNDALRVLERIK